MLTGCFKHEQRGPSTPEVSEESTASFYVGKGNRSLKLSPASSYGPFGLLPDQILDWTACLYTYSNEAIVGHKFSVVTKNKMIEEEITSDENGCIRWSETMQPNPISQPKFLMLDRYIRSEGAQRGYVKISMAVNPWSSFYNNGSPVKDVIDPAKNERLPSDILYGEEAMLHLTGDHMFASSFKYEERPTLWIDKVNINIIEEGLIPGKKSKKKVNISFNPKVIVRDYHGNELPPIAIPEGKFDVVPYIFGRMESGEFAKVASLKTETSKDLRAEVVGGRVAKTYEFTLDNLVDGRYELGLKVTPVNGPKHLRKFEGAFIIGDYFQLDNAKTVELIPEFTSKKYEDYNLDIYTADLTQDLSKFLPVEWQISPLDIRFYGVDTNLETNTERVVYFKARACISHPTRHRVVFNKSFKILMVKLPWETEDERKVADVKVRGQSGCIEWQDRIWHSVYDVQRLIVDTATFIGPNGSRKEIPFAINPWTTGWSFGGDGRFLNQKVTTNGEMKNYCDKQYEGDELHLDCSDLTSDHYEKMSHRSKPAHERPEAIGPEKRPEMFIRSFKLQKIGHQHLVNNRLDMKIKIRYRLTLNPYVLRPDSFDRGVPDVEPLRNGLYLLRMVLMTNDYVKNRFNLENNVLSTWQNVVKVKNSMIITDLDLFIKEHVALNNRASVYFQILPLDERKVYQDPSFMNALGIKFSDPDKLQKYYDYYGLNKQKLENYKPDIQTFDNPKEKPIAYTKSIDELKEHAAQTVRSFFKDFNYDETYRDGYLATYDESQLEEFEKHYFVRLHKSQYAANIDQYIEKSGMVYDEKPGAGVYKNILLEPLIFHMKVTLNQDQMSGDLLPISGDKGNYTDIGQLWGREVFDSLDRDIEVTNDTLAYIIKNESEKYFKSLLNQQKYLSKTEIYQNEAREDLKEFIKMNNFNYFEISESENDVFGEPKKSFPTLYNSPLKKEVLLSTLMSPNYNFQYDLHPTNHNIQKAENRVKHKSDFPFPSKGLRNKVEEYRNKNGVPSDKDVATYFCKYMYSDYPHEILGIPEDKFLNLKLKDDSESDLVHPQIDTRGHWNPLSEDSSPLFLPDVVSQLNIACKTRPLDFITIDKFYYTHIIDQENVEFRQGVSQNFNIHTNHYLGLSGYDSVYKNRSVSLSTGFGFDANFSGDKELFSLKGSSSDNVKGRFFLNGTGLKAQARITGAIGYTKDYASTRAKSGEMVKGDRLQFTKGMYLVVLNTQIDIPVKRFQSCMTIKINKEGFLKHIGMYNNYQQWVAERFDKDILEYTQDEFDYIYQQVLKRVFANSALGSLIKTKKVDGQEYLDISEQDLAQFLDSGILLCSEAIDVPENNSFVLLEDYYLMYQHFKPPNSQQDTGDSKNDPWLITLRGAADYKKFISMIYYDGPQTATPCQMHKLDHNEAVIDLLKHSYRNRMPSYDRVYQLLPQDDLSQYMMTYNKLGNLGDYMNGYWSPFSWQSWGDSLSEKINIECSSK